MRSYEYRHVVGLEETNIVGNVYFLNHLRWQGRCREMFLRDHAPGLLAQLADGLCLVTVSCSCDYISELMPFDEVAVRMCLGEIRQNHILMHFDYVRLGAKGEEAVAHGRQRIAVMRRRGVEVVPEPVPRELAVALEAYGTAVGKMGFGTDRGW